MAKISLYKNFRRLDILRKFINAKIFTTKVFVHENFQIYGIYNSMASIYNSVASIYNSVASIYNSMASIYNSMASIYNSVAMWLVSVREGIIISGTVCKLYTILLL